MKNWPWSELGIEKTKDKKAIQAAYAKKLKIHRPDDNPEAYQNLRRAYDAALSSLTEKAKIHRLPEVAPMAVSERVRRMQPPDQRQQPKPEPGPEPAPPPTDPWFDELTVDWNRFCELCRNLPKVSVEEWNSERARFFRLSLPMRQRLSIDFSEAILNQGVPAPILLAVADFFDWKHDFKQSKILGASKYARLLRYLEARSWTSEDLRLKASMSIRRAGVIFFAVAWLALTPVFIQNVELLYFFGVVYCILLFTVWFKGGVDWWDLTPCELSLDAEGFHIRRGRQLQRVKTLDWAEINEIKTDPNDARSLLVIRKVGRAFKTPTLDEKTTEAIRNYFAGIRYLRQYPVAVKERSKASKWIQGKFQNPWVKWGVFGGGPALIALASGPAGVAILGAFVWYFVTRALVSRIKKRRSRRR